MRSTKFNLYVLLAVASFGYFVDAADLIIASLVRGESIIALALHTSQEVISYLEIDIESVRLLVIENLNKTGAKLTQESIDKGITSHIVKTIGLSFESWQSWGLLLGGVVFGVLGDRIGRMKVLYGSIALYSSTTLINGFLSPEWASASVNYHLYCVLRFLSGFGLAAEVGAAITLVSEVMQKETRGYGSMVIASFGLLGCVFAASLVEFVQLPWDMLFKIGGILGLLLLFVRFGVHESKIYETQQTTTIARGNFLSLFTNWDRFKRLLICFLIGLPASYMVGLPIKFSKNFGESLNIPNISISAVIMTFYIAVSLGDIVGNFLSQKFQSRKKVIFFFNFMSLVVLIMFSFVLPPQNEFQYQYIYSPLFGFSIGSWALVITTSAESFGTNLRATVATSVPNFIRASFIPITIIFTIIEKHLGSNTAAGIIGVICSIISLFATYFLKETFGKDLNETEL